ncbi:hypothetical protein DFH29DRAFT_1001097 [Suillus ampliporus]|nr:hypothetical protein DFH29DRAFT_1001097 [Suillus ampliporus]
MSPSHVSSALSALRIRRIASVQSLQEATHTSIQAQDQSTSHPSAPSDTTHPETSDSCSIRPNEQIPYIQRMHWYQYKPSYTVMTSDIIRDHALNENRQMQEYISPGTSPPLEYHTSDHMMKKNPIPTLAHKRSLPTYHPTLTRPTRPSSICIICVDHSSPVHHPPISSNIHPLPIHHPSDTHPWHEYPSALLHICTSAFSAFYTLLHSHSSIIIRHRSSPVQHPYSTHPAPVRHPSVTCPTPVHGMNTLQPFRISAYPHFRVFCVLYPSAQSPIRHHPSPVQHPSSTHPSSIRHPSVT